MRDLIVLVILIWVLGLMVGKPVRNFARGILAALLGAIWLAVRLLGHAVFWLARGSVILLLLWMAYLVYRRITRNDNARRHHDDYWPPMPPL